MSYPREFGRVGTFQCQCKPGCNTKVGEYKLTPTDVYNLKLEYQAVVRKMKKYKLLNVSPEIQDEREKEIAKLNQTLNNIHLDGLEVPPGRDTLRR